MMTKKDKLDEKDLWEILKRYDVYIATTNFKAALLATLNTLLFKVTLYPDHSSYSTYPSIKAAIDAILALTIFLAIFYVLYTIWPELWSKGSSKNKTKKSLIFFEDVKSVSVSDYKRRIQLVEKKTFINDLSGQVHEVANILSTKILRMKKACYFTLASIALITIKQIL